ncbi:hypothetical protein RND81_12G094200 [Saponaria officinalis]|uniref:UspA domain-containing protein n=1 Tax=Saponaria officinalis TaxID=3572 RepID=A0AAW1H8F6_SAPOF
MGGEKRIGVAVDFSKSSKCALQWAIHNLADKGDTLYIIHVKPPSHDESRHALWLQSGSRITFPLVEFKDAPVMKKYEVQTDIEVLDMCDTATRQKQSRVQVSPPSFLSGINTGYKEARSYIHTSMMTNATIPITIVKESGYHKA